MGFLEKVKLWIKETGLTNLAYLVIGIGGKLILGSNMLFGAGLGIFIYLNWNVIRKLYNSFTKEQFNNKIN